MERLGDLLFEVAEAWKKQNVYAFDKSEMMYDCSLYDHQNKETAFKPILKDGLAIWNCNVTRDAGNNWEQVNLSIPQWLYNYYMQGKANYISFRKIQEYVN